MITIIRKLTGRALWDKAMSRNMNIKKIRRWVLFWTIVFLLGTLALPTTTAKANYIDEDTNREKITNQTEVEKDSLDLWIEDLVRYECRDCPPGYKRMVTNKKYSYGCLQFQLRTFIYQYKKYKADLSDIEIVKQINSCDVQKEIARAMFEDNAKRASNHWYTSIYKRGLGLPSV